MKAPLAVGDEAWCLLTRVVGNASASGDRSTLEGAARVRIEAIEGDRFSAVVLRASPEHAIGRRLELGRGELYATGGEEHRAFGELIARFWGVRGVPGSGEATRAAIGEDDPLEGQLELAQGAG